MEQGKLPEWEGDVLDEALEEAQRRRDQERARAARRALQLAREQGYHRLAVALDRPGRPEKGPGQLSLFPTDPRLFDDAG
jgi:hypothetical protein